MKRKRFSVEQIVAVVKQAELGLPVADDLHTK
jgi:putative transposase